MKEIQLTRGMIATVDDDDYYEVSQHKWFYHSSGYAMRMSRDTGGKRHMIRMHREIMNVTDPDIQVDHRNNNGLCNERWNLRICDQHHNNMNKLLYCKSNKKTSKYKGVSFDNRRNKWRSTITYNRKQIWLGYFYNEADAAMAYNIKAIELFGEFASLNNINGMGMK